MHLTIDLGNTLAKIGVFKNKEIIYITQFKINNLNKIIENIFIKQPNISHAIIISVIETPHLFISWLSNLCHVHILSHKSILSFHNQYKTPETIGMDRLSLVAGASDIFPNENILVIDAGTCITYDFIDASNHYLGGSISLGIDMRFKALNAFTKKLPLVSQKESTNLIGNSSETSINSGVINGVLYEMDGLINHYTSIYKNLKILLTGGSSGFLGKRLKSIIFAEQNLLLKGANTLLHLNKV